MSLRVLIVGGYGVFGGKLAELLRRDENIELLIAGRSLRRAQAFCRRHGGIPKQFDRDGPLLAQLHALGPQVVVDAAGPFQHYGSDPYRLARASLQAGAHYLDLADDADFVSGIVTLDTAAREARRTVLSGVSSVPAISSAAIEQLRRGLTRIEHIETVILPGNRAPRGLSVVRAIVSQAGRPLRHWRGDLWREQPAWGALEQVQLRAASTVLEPRWASPIGAPDLVLFPARYGARSVAFRAGLELGLLHRGLWLLAWLPRLRLVRSLGFMAPLLRFAADLLKPWGEDRGGMRVTVIGENSERGNEERQWTLIAASGDGPFIPAIPAAAWLRQRARAVAPTPGARPCVGELSLLQLAQALEPLAVTSEQLYAPHPSLFERALGDDWRRLPQPLRQLHSAVDAAEYRGEATVLCGRHPLARCARWLTRLPPAAASVPVRVSIRVADGAEHWQRRFGTHGFATTLRWHTGRRRLVESFRLLGLPLRFELGLKAGAEALHWPVTRGWFCGVPLPRWLLPISESQESVDAEGRFRFDVSIRLRGLGLVGRYHGWLAPLSARTQQPAGRQRP